MANWQRKLDIKDEWERAKAGEISMQDLARTVASKLKDLPDFGGKLEDIDLEKQDLIDAFDDLAMDLSANNSDFDSLWDELYNWGDTNLDGKFNAKKVCWIATF